MRGPGARADAWNGIAVLLLGLVVFFLFYPFISLFINAFKNASGAFTAGHFIRFFTKKYYYSTLLNSLSVSLTATAAATVLGTAMAVFLGRYTVPGKRILEVLLLVTMISPPFIGAYSWILLLGRNGLLVNVLGGLGIRIPSIYGYNGIVLVFVLKLFPFVYLYVSGAMKKIDRSLEEAAESLGVSKARRLFTVTLPLVVPTILAGALMVFMGSLADFGTPMLIGEGFRVVPVVIYTEFVGEMGGNASFASAVSIVIVVIATLAFLLQKRIVSRRTYVVSALRPPVPEKLHGAGRVLVPTFCWTVALLGILPQLTVVFTSFLATRGPMFLSRLSLDSYAKVFGRLLRPILNTLSMGLTALAVILVVGTFTSYLAVRRRSPLTGLLDAAVMFPYVIPGSVLGIVILLAFNKPPLIFSGTAMILITAFVIRRMPYTVRSGSAILHQIDPVLDEASVSLGRGPLSTFFRVTVPLMLPGVVSGAILSWITVINELSASVILYTGMTVTLSVATYTEVIRASYGTAAALSSILTALTVVSLALFYRISGKADPGL